MSDSNPENSDENKDESQPPIDPLFSNINYEFIKNLMDDAQPLVELFYAIYVNEKTSEEQVDIIHRKGVPGTISYFIENTIPAELLHIAPYHYVSLSQKCVLFGYVLHEISRRLGIEQKELSIDDLDKLWEGIDNAE